MLYCPMPVLRWATTVVSMLVAVCPCPAQEETMTRVQGELATATVGADDWWLLRCEFALALTNQHVPDGIAAAQQIQRDAKAQDHPAAAALGRLVESFGVALTEGRTTALSLVDQASRQLPPDAPDSFNGRFALLESTVLVCCERTGSAAQALKRSLRIGRSIGDTKVVCESLANLDGMAFNHGMYPPTALLIGEAMALAQQTQLPNEYITGRRTQREIMDLLHLGKEEDAVAALDQAIRDWTQSGNTAQLRDGLQLSVSLAWRHGDTLAAVTTAQRLLELAQRSENRTAEANAFDTLAWSHLLAGEPQEAQPFLEEALALSDQIDLPELRNTILETAIRIAINGNDKDGLMNYSIQRELNPPEETTGPGSPQFLLAVETVKSMLEKENARANEAQIIAADAQERQAKEAERTQFYQWARVTAALILSTILAVVFFRGKRRVENVHRQLQEQTERTQNAEVARRELEQQTVQLERLDSVGLLAAGVAHDFNNILCSVQGHAEMLLEDVEPHQRDSANAILTGAHRAAGLCKKLLDYASPTLENPVPSDLRQIVEGIRPLLTMGAGSTSEIHFEFDPNPVETICDRQGIEQVLVNLVANARDPETQAERITVRTYTAHETETGEGVWFGQVRSSQGTATIEVVDNGVGMETPQIARVFDPFFTTKREGRGLGLSAAFGIVGQHGGAFRVQSSPGEGSRFAMHLPSKAQAPNPKPEAPPSTVTPNSPRGSILVVDDDVTVLRWLQGALEQRGWNVVTANGGQCGIDQFELHYGTLSVVLLDVNMPEVDGREVLHRIRKSSPDLPVVVMSGLGARFLRDRLGNDTSHSVLTKPFTFAELDETLHRVHSGSPS